MNSASDGPPTSGIERSAELVAEEGGADEQAESRFAAGETATPSGIDPAASRGRSSGDSGRELQPSSEQEVERSSDTAEHLGAHNTPMDDDAGINPGGG